MDAVVPLEPRRVWDHLKVTEATEDNNFQWFMSPACIYTCMHVWIMYKHCSTFIYDFGIILNDRCDLNKGSQSLEKLAFQELWGYNKPKDEQLGYTGPAIAKMIKIRKQTCIWWGSCSMQWNWWLTTESAVFIDLTDCWPPFLMHFQWILLLE